jgi:hypothetical protein
LEKRKVRNQMMLMKKMMKFKKNFD